MQRFVSILLVLLVFRVLLIAQTGILPSPIITLGSDLVTASILALIAPFLGPPILRAAAMGLIALGYFAGGEHLLTHGTLFRVGHLHYLADPGFVGTTMDGTSLGWLIAYLACALPLFFLLRGETRLATPALAGAIVTVLGTYALAADSLTRPASNVVSGSLAQLPGLATASIWSSGGDTSGVGSAEHNDFYQTDASQERLVAGNNVLLIMIEGLSGAYLPSVAAHHDLQPGLQLPQLERALDQHGFKIYRNMITHQRQTDRGTYPLLCADYPRMRLMQSEMSEVAELDEELDCLPARLSEAGYRTAYLQAADLSFMQKDRFMPLAGFDVAIGNLGNTGDTPASDTTTTPGWGASDRRFHRAALDELQRLEGGDAPWFATMLNVGTHHPFASPRTDAGEADEEMLPAGEDRQARRVEAFRAMGAALTDLVEGMESQGLLEETTLIITSDESAGFLRQSAEPGPLDSNFGMLAVRPANNQRETLELQPVTALTAQVDIPISILDLSDANPTKRMIGRSLVRPVNSDRRHLIAGDTYAGRVHFIRSSGEVLGCDEALVRCASYRFQPGALLGSLESTDDAPFLTLAERRDLIQATHEIRPLDLADRQ
ncbi:MAG: sulfatase-like hydrolase/transferase [Spiribacter salinus]|uniref:Sulfatase-like hydrolase/transferase n=1 Tax=Spiribacter salinus TaxID=1335746 RepID=A0A540VSB8_9GAMM|nr:MAG: sulfatase-like hydrolase/transferase [Spiribacter salinus]